MEKLKRAIPENLKRLVGESTQEDLARTCSSLLDFLLLFPPFHHMVEDLADSERAMCGKNKEDALKWKHKGNHCFATGDLGHALDSYSQALRLAPIDADDMDRNLAATLYLNRAFVLYKMNLLTECVRDCNHSLQISPTYAKAWYRRGMANASLGIYKDAINDLNVAKIVEVSSGGRSQIESELQKLLDQRSKTTCLPLQPNVNNLNILDEPHQIKLQCVNTSDKARGMASTSDISPASLVHNEEPFAIIISKNCRESHCHYCLNELPRDKVPCTSCSIPYYCSQKCQLRAGGKMFNYPKSNGIHENLTSDLAKYVTEITLGDDSETDSEHIPEHKHECKGAHWPLVLPSEIVLAGRLFVKSIMQRGLLKIANLREILELSHHYSQMSPESKLESQIYSTVLLSCLQHSSGFEIQLNGFSIAQVVILIAQIRVNSMTIVRIKSADVHGLDSQFKRVSPGALTSYVEQVKVGQAIYRAGSLFNHSCQPNIHAYFLSRTLCIRTTEFVAAGCPLELSYGPQVGQWDSKDRNEFLEDEYSFHCQCSGCSKANLSDLVLNAFQCVKPNCSGIVLDCCALNCEKHKPKKLTHISSTSSSEPHLQVENFNNDNINEVTLDVFLNSSSLSTNRGFCLKCGAYSDLESSRAKVNKAWKCIRRLQDALVSEDISSSKLSDASRSLDLLKSTLHAYNRSIAEVEDILAQAFCLVGDLQPARDHCKASIEILEKLYTRDHIVIGHELVKLSSMQLALRDSTAIDTVNRLDKIFSCYYGSHAKTIFPHLQLLQEETQKLAV
ncbi:N-terminal acetyltransferase A, auxiliary subunit [Parasponia andersonii]|uniref:N-terminal acetyltransferase A, auxiliary subunit n=1 Tax=Parasponia andersonii TaxID=3476 RepID=A0A2P5DCT5_PARAD|nr:N-terminal acetyltransferase A, auxiliary subunit [Parasponia andersonii]